MNDEIFRQQLSNYQFARSQRRPKQPKTSDKLTVSYKIRVTHGEHLVQELSSSFEVPAIAEPDYVEGSAADLAQVFETLVAKPLATAVALYCSRHAADSRTQTNRSGQQGEPTASQEPEVEFKSPQVHDPFPHVPPPGPPSENG